VHTFTRTLPWTNELIKWNYLSAFFTPDHNAPVTGGINLSDPIGGEAYGIPLNTSTAPRFRFKFSNCTIVPDTAPYFVCTILDDICEWSLDESSPPDDIVGVMSVISNAMSNMIHLFFPLILLILTIFHSHILHILSFHIKFIIQLLIRFWCSFDSFYRF